MVSDEFEKFYTVDLPAPLNENRLAALHLFDAVSCEFESWVRDAVTEIYNGRAGLDERVFTIDDIGVKAMMHRMIGAGIFKTRNKLCPVETHDDPIYMLINALSCKHDQAKQDSAYMAEWYPDELQDENMGKLHLVAGSFTAWGAKLILFALNFYTKNNLIQHRSICIKVGLERLKKDESIVSEFRAAIQSDEQLKTLALSNADITKVHLILATKKIRAYSGFRWLE